MKPNWKKVSMALFGIILLFGAVQIGNTIAQTFEEYEIQVNQSYAKGLEAGFSIGQEFQMNMTNDYIIQSLQQQGFVSFQLRIGNETGNVKLVVGE